MYNLEVFTDQFEYVDFDFIDERQPLDMDYLAYNAYTVTTKMMDAKKGYFVRITRDNVHVASGYIADVQPGKTTQEISIKPLQSLFDVEVYYTAVTDCITWLATNINAALMNNADTLQNRPITLTYTPSANPLPLTGFNLHKTVNLLSVMISALKTYGVVCEMSLDVTNKHILVNIAQQTATQVIEANLENVLQSSVTLGDSYGSTNKLIIRKTDKDSGNNLGETIFYLHPDGTIDTTNNNRIYPVFWELETLDTEDDQTAAQWNEKALARAKEVLTPAKYDNEIVLMYDVDDQIVHPADAQIGTDTTIYLDGLTYASILTGKKIEGQKITLTYGVVRQDLTKKLAIRQRETMTFENTASAIIQEAREVFPSKSAVANAYVKKTGDTMTGNLYNTGGYVQRSPINRDVNPTSTIFYPSIALRDTNNQELGSLHQVQDTVGNIGVQLEASPTFSGQSRRYNNVRLWVNKDGTFDVSLSHPAEWREALAISGISASQGNQFLKIIGRYPASGTGSFAMSSSFTMNVTVPNGYKILAYMNLQSNGSIHQGAYVLTDIIGMTGNVSFGCWCRFPSAVNNVYFTLPIICIRDK